MQGRGHGEGPGEPDVGHAHSSLSYSTVELLSHGLKWQKQWQVVEVSIGTVFSVKVVEENYGSSEQKEEEKNSS